VANDPDSLVLIGVAQNELEANVWRDVLARDSIGVLVKDADPLAVMGVTPRPGTIQVFVKARDEKRARWLLGDGLATE